MYEIPHFQHDCDSCTFLGRHLSHKSSMPLDLYACTRNNGIIDTVIARYSSNGPDYSSGLIFAIRGIIPELVEALERAKKIGLKLEQLE